MGHQAVTGDGRGAYPGPVPHAPKAPEQTDIDRAVPDDFLEANYCLAREFYPGLDRQTFQDYWAGEFKFLAGQGLKGQLQLNFPEIPLCDLMEKYRELTRRLKGFGEDVEGVRNYYPDYFTPEMLRSADTGTPDWVTLIVENDDAGDNNDPTLFGLGLPCGVKSEDGRREARASGTMYDESRRLIGELRRAKPELEFMPGSARTRVIQSLHFMRSRLAKKENTFFSDQFRIKFWAVQLLLSGRSAGGWVPYIFLDGGGGACLGREGGSGNSVYGFCIQARRKA